MPSPERPSVIIDVDPNRSDFLIIGQELIESIVELLNRTSISHPSDGDALKLGILRGMQNHFGLEVGESQNDRQS